MGSLIGWPGLSDEAAKLLMIRGVRLAGTDCLSIDHFTSTDFPALKALLGSDVLIGENFANLDKLPPWCFLAAMPLPIENGTGSPARATVQHHLISRCTLGHLRAKAMATWGAATAAA